VELLTDTEVRKMKKTVACRILLGFVWLLSLGFFCGQALAAEFSADLVQTRGGETNQGKFYLKGDKQRTEIVEARQSSIIITDVGSKKSYMLNPKDKMYMDLSAMGGGQSQSQSEEELKKLGEWKNAGTETVNGYECEKKIFVYKDKSMGEMTHWISKKLSYPIKMFYQARGMTMITEYKNIKEGGVDDKLFQVPPGYQKMAMPGMGVGKMPMGSAGADDEGDEDDEGAPKPPAKGKKK
jgi:outer membrane lipoprotein-sorting protein